MQPRGNVQRVITQRVSGVLLEQARASSRAIGLPPSGIRQVIRALLCVRVGRVGRDAQEVLAGASVHRERFYGRLLQESIRLWDRDVAAAPEAQPAGQLLTVSWKRV